MNAQTGWTDGKVMERAEFVCRTVSDLCELLRAGAEYHEVAEQIALARGALESIRVALLQREPAGSAGPARRGPTCA